MDWRALPVVFVLACAPLGSVSAQTYLQGSTTLVTSCAGTYYDSGGPTGEYSNSESSTITFCDPASGTMRVTFTSFETESGFDQLVAYDGMDTSGTSLGSHEGTSSPGTLSATSGCMTFQFTSDGSVVRSGWEATLSCGTATGGEPGDPCGAAADCSTGYCVGGVCCESACDDGLSCNGTETCAGGFCASGTPLDCNDFDPCTTDTCGETTGCRNDPIPGCGGVDGGGGSLDAGGVGSDGGGVGLDAGGTTTDGGTVGTGRRGRRDRGCSAGGAGSGSLWPLGLILVALTRRRLRG